VSLKKGKLWLCMGAMVNYRFVANRQMAKENE